MDMAFHAELGNAGGISTSTESKPLAVHAHLPAHLIRVVKESGILQEGGDFDWLHDQTAIDCLQAAYESHYGQCRKRGDKEHRAIHEVWCAHQIYNNKELTEWLDAHDIPRIWAVIGMLLHDKLENEGDYALKNGLAFDKIDAFEKIKVLLKNDKLYEYLEVHCFDFMTDDPSLPKDQRIPAQQAKAFDSDGELCLTPLQQCWRIYDKLSHIVLDARSCIKEIKRLETIEFTRSLDVVRAMTSLRQLKKDVDKSLTKAEQKSFPFNDYPLAQNDNIKGPKDTALSILNFVAKVLTPDLTKAFKVVAREELEQSRRESANKNRPDFIAKTFHPILGIAA